VKDRGVFFSFFRPYRPQIAIGTLCVFLSTGISLLAPSVVGRAIDDLKQAISTVAVLRFAGLILLISAVSGIFLFFQRRILIGVSRDMEFDIRNDFFDHFTRLPLEFYREHRTGDLMSRAVNDLTAVRMMLGPGLMQSLNTLVTASIAIVLMFRVDGTLTLLALATLPLTAASTKIVGQKIHVLFEKVQEYFSEMSARAQENFAGARVVRAFTRQSSEIEMFRAANREYMQRNRRIIKVSALFYPLLQTLVGVSFVLVLWQGGRLVLSEKITVGRFVEFNLYLVEMVWPMIALGWVVNLLQRGAASWNRIREIRDTEPAIRDVAPLVTEFSPRGEIEFRKLSYSSGGVRILSDIDLKIRAGSFVGIVGRTGSGKTTLVSFIPRLLDPPPGTLFFDGLEAHRIPLADLRRDIGMVTQDTFLFSETIAGNLSYGAPDAETEAVEQAGDIAGLTLDIERFPDKWNTQIGERGITLSGGQKQRAAIARAILRAPSILILDDSLSAVDSETEARIQNRLRDVVGRRTTLLIAHRLSSLRDADEIVVLDEGRIVERGSHRDLVARGGAYARMWERQRLEEEVKSA
jgi:ATP-binding cassette, subfamily B, multidrug efflux pump